MNQLHSPSLLGVDTNLAVLLDALLLHQSVSKAAEHVGLSQSALSHALGRLRVHYNDELLTRAGRGMVITPRGSELQPVVRAAVLAMEQAFAPQPQFTPATLTQSFSLIMTDLLEMTLLPEIDSQLRLEAPGVDFQALPAGIDVAGELRRGRADAAVAVRLDLPPDFNRTLMMQGEYVVVMRHDHPMAKGRLTTKKLTSMEHVLVSPMGSQRTSLIDATLAKEGVERRIARRTSSFWGALLLVSRSDYAATLPAAVANATSQFLNLKVTTAPFPLSGFDYDLVWHRRTNDDPAQEWFREMILECAARVAASGLS
ncbi:MAG: LysR family transcriptional regulator [bacterium]|nr:LysR family transcriptional regulator [bacterium]